MRAPQMNLPPSTMPWGRWLQGTVENLHSGLNAEAANSRSEGSQFRARTDQMAANIASIHTYRMFRGVAPDVSVSIAPNGTPTLVSTSVTIPADIGPSSLIGIANFSLSHEGTNIDSFGFDQPRATIAGATSISTINFRNPRIVPVRVDTNHEGGNILCSASTEYLIPLGFPPSSGTIHIKNARFWVVAYGATR